MYTLLLAIVLVAVWGLALGLTSRIKVNRIQESTEAYLYLLPAAVILAVFWFLPVVFSVLMSFTDWGSGSKFDNVKWVGFANYLRALKDDTFRLTFWNTVNYVIYSVPLTLVAALGVALLLNSKVRGRNGYRTLYFLPYVTTWVAISIVFKYVFDERAGLANFLLERIGLPGYGWLNEGRGIYQVLMEDHLKMKPIELHPMLAGPSLAMFAVILTSVWRDTGYFMVIFLAGLQNIDRSYYEAAEIDGANSWQRFRHVTVPLLSPTTLFILIVSMIAAFKVFTPMYIMTPTGGPGKTTATLVFHMYEAGFQGYHELGYAAAVAYLLFLVILALTVFQNTVFGKKVHYD